MTFKGLVALKFNGTLKWVRTGRSKGRAIGWKDVKFNSRDGGGEAQWSFLIKIFLK